MRHEVRVVYRDMPPVGLSAHLTHLPPDDDTPSPRSQPNLTRSRLLWATVKYSHCRLHTPVDLSWLGGRAHLRACCGLWLVVDAAIEENEAASRRKWGAERRGADPRGCRTPYVLQERHTGEPAAFFFWS